MEKNSPEHRKQDRIYLWDKQQCKELLSGLSLAPGTLEFAAFNSEKMQHTQPGGLLLVQDALCDISSTGSVTSSEVVCSVCLVTLQDRSAQIQHYQTGYHKENQRRALKRLTRLSLPDYRKQCVSGSRGGGNGGTVSNGGYESSESCSDDHTDSDTQSTDHDYEDEEEEEEEGEEGHAATPHMGRKPRVFFLSPATGQVVSLFRTLLIHGKAEAVTEAVLAEAAEKLPGRMRWSFIMESGGHFAAAVFQDDRVVMHKTFHSYTVRAGQGGSQATCDSQSGSSHPRSAGASLRRYNEASHHQHIQELLDSWREILAQSDLVFVRVGWRCRGLVLGNGGSGRGTTPLSAADPRIRTVPFCTRKPSFAEIRRVHRMLAHVMTHGTNEEFHELTLSEAVSEMKSKPRSPSDIAAQQRRSSRQCRKDRAKLIRDLDAQPSSSSTTTTTSEDEPEIPLADQDRSHTPLHQDFELDLSLENERKTKKNKRKTSRKDSGKKHENDRAVGTEERVCLEEEEEEQQKSVALEAVCNALYSACAAGDLSRLQLLHECCASGQTDTMNVCEVGPGVTECVRKYAGRFKLLQLRLGNLHKTPLHVASEHGYKDVVRWLLESAECSPATLDAHHRPPYTYSANKPTRLVFRAYRAAHPHAHDYTKTAIPAPISKEEETRINEAKKAQKTVKKERQREKKQKQEELFKEQRERERFLCLSDREKRALAAERRLLASSGSSATSATSSSVAPRPVLQRCFQCANDISGLVPFEYSDYKFCSTACVRMHRDQRKPPSGPVRQSSGSGR